MIEENVSLKSHNTFGVEASTRYFAEANTFADLETILDWYRAQSDVPLLILGGGSNLLFTKDWEGLTLKLSLPGKSLTKEWDDAVLVTGGAGEDWHDFVLWTLQNGWNGLENLSLIPGSVGASPMQNIGAYGVETKDVFWLLEAINIKTGTLETFTAEACNFGYRDSIFKQSEKGKWIIVSVTFRLKKDGVVKIDYGTIQTVLSAHGIENPTPMQVSQAVTTIRQAKLPDPKILGSAGSFFKNPVLTKPALEALKKILPDVPHYEFNHEKFKVPAGFLIDKAGWKGKNFGAYGVHKEQALVLVNYGEATGSQIFELAQRIQSSVKLKYLVGLELEVNII